MASILRMIAVLSLLCASSGFLLSYLKMTTAGRIEEQVLTYVQGPALAEVFPDAENVPLTERHTFTLPDGRSVTVFPARKDGKLYGVAMENSAPGFGGDISVITGFDASRDALIGIGITTMKETPGIGTQVSDPSFTTQFRGVSLPVALSSGGGSNDAISGATISSTGVVDAVARATEDYETLKEQILSRWQ